MGDVSISIISELLMLEPFRLYRLEAKPHAAMYVLPTTLIFSIRENESSKDNYKQISNIFRILKTCAFKQNNILLRRNHL